MQIVAIGASAGGIDAFRLFFERLPDDTGMGFVVVLHLSATRKSLLPEIIGRWTAMTVTEAADGELVEPDRVYVVPPGHIATMGQGRLHLRHVAPDVARETNPIDQFFDSLAADLGADAVGIVLSGTGHDGALGLKAIKARGGLTLAQGSDTRGTNGTAPQHSGMPDSAIATGAVDLIVPVQDMPRLVIGARDGTAVADRSADIDADRLAICEILHARLGHDFSQYKNKTFLRRVERRVQVLGLTTLPDYIARLEQAHEEVVLLFRDLLIGVTKFFRDEAAFAALKSQVLPRLFDGKGAGDAVRVWVVGCATGEEAYSIAITLREYMDGLSVIPRVQVFATDIDEPAIGTARAGRYPATLLDGMAPARCDRFFARTENSYLVTREIRDLCTFSAHSLVRDPPFSRMDLVSCRNLLIYMDTDLQATVIPAFHYSLLPGGCLLLGSSETVSRHEDLFAPLDKGNRIFLRRDGPSPPLKVSPRFARGTQGARVVPGFGEEDDKPASRTDWQHSLAIAARRVLERFASPYVVVTEEGEVVHYSSHVGGVLQPALGPPSRSVFDMVRQRSMRRSARIALRKSVESGHVEQIEVPPEAPERGPVTVVVEPLPGYEPDRPFLIVFRETGPPHDEPADATDAASTHSMINELERENRDLREQLQSLGEEHETALEELRSSNEELHSVNEELQSSNEELETSKEEIQSVNEELQTVNAQLSTKVDELDRANADLRNLFDSTRVATLFLDRHMVIRAYTPEISTIYNLIPTDRGRPLTDIVNRLDYDELHDDVVQVMRTLQPLERRVSRRDKSVHYLLRILPYRAPDSSVDGSLVTFVDVTRMVQAEEHQRLLVDELNHRVKNMLTVVVSLASQTLRRTPTLDAFSDVFLGRLQALTAAYTLLTRENWSSVQLREIVEEELRPFVAPDRANIRIEGPAVSLDSRSALALGLALHELATNAVKYGALSVTEGDVAVTWSLEGEDASELVLTWVECHGPPVEPPATRGFGRSLIEQALAHDMRAEATLEFTPDGVRATVRAPMSGSASRAGSADRCDA